MKTLAVIALSLGLLAVAQSDERFSSAQKAQMENLLQQRFAQADTNHDGQVTRDEANGVMPRLFRHFAQVDADHSGAVTMDEIHQAIAVIAMHQPPRST